MPDTPANRQSETPSWVDPVMRIGYAARGLTYFILGALAFLAARSGAAPDGPSDAFAALRGQPLGLAALALLALGLLAFALWRGLDAWMDLEDKGHHARGLIARIGQAITGVLHIGLALTAARIAFGLGGGQGDDKAQSLTSWMLTKPHGDIVIICVGAITLATGAYYGHKAWAEKYRDDLRASRVLEWLEPVIKIGLVAHGLVIALIGGFLVYAGLTADPEQAGSIGKAFETVRQQPYGQILLALLGLGLLAFGIFCWIEAAFRLPPRRAAGTPSYGTLARIKAETRQTLESQKAQAKARAAPHGQHG